VVANRYREDMHRAGAKCFCSGFAVAVPEGGGPIVVRRALDGAVLPMAAEAQAA